MNRVRSQINSRHFVGVDAEQVNQIHSRRPAVGDDVIRRRNRPPYLIQIIAPAIGREKLRIVHKRQIVDGDDATFGSADWRDEIGAMEYIQIMPE